MKNISEKLQISAVLQPQIKADLERLDPTRRKALRKLILDATKAKDLCELDRLFSGASYFHGTWSWIRPSVEEHGLPMARLAFGVILEILTNLAQDKVA